MTRSCSLPSRRSSEKGNFSKSPKRLRQFDRYALDTRSFCLIRSSWRKPSDTGFICCRCHYRARFIVQFYWKWGQFICWWQFNFGWNRVLDNNDSFLSWIREIGLAQARINRDIMILSSQCWFHAGKARWTWIRFKGCDNDPWQIIGLLCEAFHVPCDDGFLVCPLKC
jgi:hypothetical protein